MVWRAFIRLLTILICLYLGRLSVYYIKNADPALFGEWQKTGEGGSEWPSDEDLRGSETEDIAATNVAHHPMEIGDGGVQESDGGPARPVRSLL